MDKKNDCLFCEWLAKLKDDEKYWRQNLNRKGMEEYSTRYEAALIDISYYKDQPSGRTTYGGYELNYCPVCGKEAEKGEIESGV